MKMAEVLARIDERLAELGMTQNKASNLAKRPDSIRNLRRRIRDGEPGGMTVTTIFRLAPVLECSPYWLLGADDDGNETEADANATIPVADVLPAIEMLLELYASATFPPDEDEPPSPRRPARVLLRTILKLEDHELGQDRAETIRELTEQIARQFPQVSH